MNNLIYIDSFKSEFHLNNLLPIFNELKPGQSVKIICDFNPIELIQNLDSKLKSEFKFHFAEENSQWSLECQKIEVPQHCCSCCGLKS